MDEVSETERPSVAAVVAPLTRKHWPSPPAHAAPPLALSACFHSTLPCQDDRLMSLLVT